jgi:DNA-binding transcriptional regulator YiaG
MSLLLLTHELLEIEKRMENQEEILPLIQAKVDSCVMYRQTIESQIDLLKKKELEIKMMRQSLERKQDKFESYLLMCLDHLGKKELNGEVYSISARKPLKRVEIVDQSLIPDSFKAIKTEEIVDKNGIKQAILDGMTIDGVKLVDGERSVTIKGRI